MRLAFVWPWDGAKAIKPLQKDGLMTTIELIGEKHQVDWYLGGEEPKDEYDWILVWGVASVPFNHTIEKYKAKKALLCAGHTDDNLFFPKFDCVFIESPLAYKLVKPYCRRAVLAFGVDTDFYKPLDIGKYVDAVYPATFSPWKRQQLFAEAVGDRGLCFGTVQDDGYEYYEHCTKKNTMALAGLVHTKIMPLMYNMARTCIITSYHGSERTALEAMACNIPLVVTNDNVLTCSLLPEVGAIACDPNPENIRKAFEQALTMKVNTRDYILENYSVQVYAKKILKVIEDE